MDFVMPELLKGNMAEKYPFEEITIGTGRILKEGEDIAILTFGHPRNFAAAAIRDVKSTGLNPAHYDIRFVKPLDEPLLHKILQNSIRLLL